MTENLGRSATHATESGIGAVGLLDVLRGMAQRRKKLIIVSTLLFAALGYLVIAVSEPVYTASSQVLVEYEDTPYTRSGAPGATAMPRQITERDVRSQVEVVRSRDLALKVLRRLDLVGSEEFDPLKRGIGLLGQLKIALGFAPDPRRQTPQQRALAVWEKNLKAYSLPNTKVIVIEFNSSSPQTAAAVANALAEAYVEQTRATRLARTSEAREWLREQIEKLRRKVVEAERAVEEWRARAGLFQGVQARLHNQQLSELSAQIVRAAAERSQAEAKARAIRRLLKSGQVEKSADVLRSPLIQRLREQQVQIRRRLAELSTVYLDNHPRVKAVRRELADLKRQINAEARKIAESLEEQARIAAAREAELRARLARMKAQVSAASQDEVKLRQLQREAKAQRALLESFLARYTDALTREDKQALPGMARIIARAWPPAAPSFPKPGPIMLLSVLAGLVMGLGLAFILEVMAAVRRAEDSGITPQAVDAASQPASVMAAPRERHVEPAIVHDSSAAVPRSGPLPSARDADGRRNAAQDDVARHAHDDAHDDARDDAHDESAQAAVGHLATAAAARIRRWHEDEHIQRIAFTALQLPPAMAAAAVRRTAETLARELRVIVLDAAEGDWQLPGAGTSAPGLAELLAGTAGFADVVRMDSALPQLHMVPAGGKPLAGLLKSDTMHQLLQALQDNYDLVLFNEGEPRYPLRGSDSALPLVRAVVILHDEGAGEVAAGLQDALSTVDGMHVACIMPRQDMPSRAARDDAAATADQPAADCLTPAAVARS